MKGRLLGVGAVALLVAVAAFEACGKGGPLVELPPPGPDNPSSDGGVPDAGPADAGTGSDAGTPDAGGSDAGGSDAGSYAFDAGTVILPNASGWQFFGPQNGGPREVLGVTSDAAGNVWVAGGDDGLFLMTPGSASFRRFTVADGLTGTDDGTGIRPQRVLSVSGGPANTVFVGYQGLPGCQDAFELYTGAPDPNAYHPDPVHQYIWKSGDADRVTLSGTGIAVSHYDISSGPGVVAAEPMGREKLCTILRIAYHGPSNSLWFGGNHGVAWGNPNSTGVVEHTHPAVNGFVQRTAPDGGVTYSYTLLTDAYYGLSPQRNTGALWLGGANRSAYFPCTNPSDFWTCDNLIQQNKIDLWPDAVPLDAYPSQRVDDNVTDMAARNDGAVFASSINNGLILWDSAGGHPFKDTSVEPNSKATALELDPSDGSLWIGYIWGGLSRLKDGHTFPYDWRVFGQDIIQGQIPDIQSDVYNGQRRILVAFQGTFSAGKPGVIGIYTGP